MSYDRAGHLYGHFTHLRDLRKPLLDHLVYQAYLLQANKNLAREMIEMFNTCFICAIDMECCF